MVCPNFSVSPKVKMRKINAFTETEHGITIEYEDGDIWFYELSKQQLLDYQESKRQAIIHQYDGCEFVTTIDQVELKDQ